MNNFRYCLTLAKLLYEVEGNEDDLIELALVGFRLIGNKRSILKKKILPIIDGCITVPCDCEAIEAVVYIGSEEPYSEDLSKQVIEDYIESYKVLTHPYYVSGKFVRYVRSGNILQVNERSGSVLILYHSSVADEDGLPEITDKEALALADYIGYYEKFKEAIRDSNQSALTLAQSIKSNWLIHCDAARTPDYIDQNTMDEAANAAVSWNRKKYNRSYKPLI